MKKSNRIGFILLLAFMGILSMPLLAAPAASYSDDRESNLILLDNGGHTNQWLICSISESEEFNTRTSATNSCIALFSRCLNYHSNIHKVLFTQIRDRKDIKLPKERIYLSNSCFTI